MPAVATTRTMRLVCGCIAAALLVAAGCSDDDTTSGGASTEASSLPATESAASADSAPPDTVESTDQPVTSAAATTTPPSTITSTTPPSDAELEPGPAGVDASGQIEFRQTVAGFVQNTVVAFGEQGIDTEALADAVLRRIRH